jgi:hypothetical protein
LGLKKPPPLLQNFSVLIFYLGLYFGRSYFLEERTSFFSDSRWRLVSKMAVDVQDGSRIYKKHNSGISQYV